MVEPLRHRQTKEAVTDMFYLPPPRHISTLPIAKQLSARGISAYWGWPEMPDTHSMVPLASGVVLMQL